MVTSGMFLFLVHYTVPFPQILFSSAYAHVLQKLHVEIILIACLKFKPLVQQVSGQGLGPSCPFSILCSKEYYKYLINS